MFAIKYKCMICGREAAPLPQSEFDCEKTVDDVCDRCRDAVMFMRKIMRNEGVLVKDTNGCYKLLLCDRGEEK